MSIVICIVDRNVGFFMAADRRAKKNGIINDNYEKIYEIKKKMYFAMTGIAEAGHEILKVIKSNTNLSVSELIELTDSVFQPNITMLTIMLAGENEEGEFFIWQKNHEGEIMKADISAETIAFSISTNENIELYRKHITQQLQASTPAELAISETINFASRIDDNISPTYTIIKQIKMK